MSGAGPFQELLDTWRDVSLLDSRLGCPLLAVGLRIAKPVGNHDRLHDPECCAQVGRSVACTEVLDQFVQQSAIFWLDREANSLSGHISTIDLLLIVCNPLQTTLSPGSIGVLALPGAAQPCDPELVGELEGELGFPLAHVLAGFVVIDLQAAAPALAIGRGRDVEGQARPRGPVKQRGGRVDQPVWVAGVPQGRVLAGRS